MNICKVNNCNQPVKEWELCSAHAMRMKRNGQLHEDIPIKKLEKQAGKECSVNGCNEENLSKGFCQLHYNRFKVTGNSGTVHRLTGKPGEGHTTKEGYRIICVNGIKMKEHRYVMEIKIGRKLSSDENVHHINGIKFDNRESNLELWSSKQPKGQRVIDKIRWAKEILNKYADIQNMLEKEAEELYNQNKYN